jgi:UDP-GlcNAc:undecaprenyl-phosphate GlcNAc-1-phosphate transferase
MFLFLWILFHFLYIGLMVLITKKLFSIFQQKEWMTSNYKGEPVIQSFGLNLMLHYLLYFAGYLILMKVVSLKATLFHEALFILLITVLTFMGWIDDQYGTNEIRGLRGHFRAFFYDKKVTSGFIKALLGTAISFVVAYFFSQDLLTWLFGGSVLALSIHFFNLLDVRPGRTIKSFWLLALVVLPLVALQDILTLALPIMLSTLILFHYDRYRLAMIGDVGSNVLGGVFGFYLLLSMSVPLQVTFFSSFLLLSLLSEKYSFTAYINNTPWLSKLDNWGIR